MYISNGTEGMMYEEAYCSKCIHYWADKDWPGCPIWTLHELWNNEQHPEYAKTDVERAVLEAHREVLDLLIPQGEYTDAGYVLPTCPMFVRDTRDKITQPLPGLEVK